MFNKKRHAARMRRRSDKRDVEERCDDPSFYFDWCWCNADRECDCWWCVDERANIAECAGTDTPDHILVHADHGRAGVMQRLGAGPMRITSHPLTFRLAGAIKRWLSQRPWRCT